MDNLKILTEQDFLEQLELKSDIPADVKSSVIFYTQHKNFSFNPYLYSAILKALDTTSDKKLIKPAEVLEIAYKMSEKYSIIQNDKYEKSDEEIANKNHSSEKDSFKEEKKSHVLSFATELHKAYETLSSEQKTIINKGFDEFIFTEDGLEQIKELRQILKNDTLTEKNLENFLKLRAQDDSIFELLQIIYSKTNGNKKIFESKFSILEQLLVAHRLTFKNLSLDTLSEILMDKKEDLGLKEIDISSFVISKKFKTTSFKKDFCSKQEEDLLFNTISDVPVIFDLMSQYQHLEQQISSVMESSKLEAPISDSEFAFEDMSEELNVSLQPDLFLSFNLGQEEFLHFDETSSMKENITNSKIAKKEKFSLKDRITGFINLFIKKQNQLSNNSFSKSGSSIVAETNNSNEKNSSLLDVFKTSLKSLRNLFKHNEIEAQNTPITISQSTSNPETNDIFTEGITSDTLSRIESIGRISTEKSLSDSKSSQKTPIAPEHKDNIDFDKI